MLRSLSLTDFILVDSLELELSAGFTVLTGETGAGKSILFDALGVVLGERADASMVREGARKAEVAAEFDVVPALHAWMQEQDLEGETLLLRRSIDTQGRSRAWINGRSVTASQLREVGDALVDLHGQHAHQSLLKSTAQRQLLDEHGVAPALRTAVQQSWGQWQALATRLDLAQEQASQLQAEREQLLWLRDQLLDLALPASEWEQLEAEHRRLSHAQGLISGVQSLLDLLDEGEHPIDAQLARATHELTALQEHDARLSEALESLESARIAAADAASTLHRYLGTVEPDPERLAELDGLLSRAATLSRRLRLPHSEFADRLQEIEVRLRALNDLDQLDALREQVKALELNYQDCAMRLRQARTAAAQTFAAAVSESLQTLAMPGGRFEVCVELTRAGPSGIDEVRFDVAGHAGATPRPLAKVASGGELARIALAISVIASRSARVPTLLFDEVDSGVGGAVAEVVGRLLAELGQRHQVLCVTHLPQVAALAAQQLRVSKSSSSAGSYSQVQWLDANGRVDEIARMLGGLDITATTRRHARELLRKASVGLSSER